MEQPLKGLNHAIHLFSSISTRTLPVSPVSTVRSALLVCPARKINLEMGQLSIGLSIPQNPHTNLIFCSSPRHSNGSPPTEAGPLWPYVQGHNETTVKRWGKEGVKSTASVTGRFTWTFAKKFASLRNGAGMHMPLKLANLCKLSEIQTHANGRAACVSALHISPRLGLPLPTSMETCSHNSASRQWRGKCGSCELLGRGAWV